MGEARREEVQQLFEPRLYLFVFARRISSLLSNHLLPLPGVEREQGSAPRVSKKLGRGGEGTSEYGVGLGRKENSFARLNPSPCSLFFARFVPFARATHATVSHTAP